MKKNDPGIDVPLSSKVGELDKTIERLKQKYVRLWWETDSAAPNFFKTYTPKEQKQVEKEMSRLMENFADYMARYQPADGVDAADMDFSGPIATTKEYVDRLFRLVGVSVDKAFTDGVTRTTQSFIERVNAFDPGMPPENVYQALRNVWIMNTLQVYLGEEMGYSGSIFAYSMLYPYTDNIMDDVFLSREEKFGICRSLKERLEGKPYPKDGNGIYSAVGEKLDAMVGLIENDFSRDGFPGVFQSLLGIYNSQIKSLMQQRRNVPPYVVDIVGVSFEKGGTSVLADGYLIKGQLDEREEDFCFGLGTLLQLADDIQDIVPDKRNGHMTLFSHVAGQYKTDALANKLFNYISMILGQGLRNPDLRNLEELMHRSYYIHVMEAVGKNGKLYSDGYVRMLERHFPCRFSFLKKLRKSFNKVLVKQKKRAVPLDVVSAGLMALSARVYE